MILRMSTVASVYVVKSADLPGILEGGVEKLYEALPEQAEELEDAFLWSGWVLYWVLDYLSQEGVDLASARFDVPEDAIGMTIVEPAAKALLPRLDPLTHKPTTLRAALARRGTKFDEVELAAFDALSMLYDAIEALPEDCVLVIECGV